MKKSEVKEALNAGEYITDGPFTYYFVEETGHYCLCCWHDTTFDSFDNFEDLWCLLDKEQDQLSIVE